MTDTSVTYEADGHLPPRSLGEVSAGPLVYGSSAPSDPSRAPLSDEEMDALLRLLGNLRTSLLWHCCDWAELARTGRLPPAELEAKARALFAAWQGRLVGHLQRWLADAPTVEVDAPPEG
jgi:hypothetical protein